MSNTSPIYTFEHLTACRYNEIGGDVYGSKRLYSKRSVRRGSIKSYLRRSIECVSDGKMGVVSLIYAMMDRGKAEEKLYKLMETNKESYYMIYSVPLDTDLIRLEHYPSIAISRIDTMKQFLW